MIKLYSSITLLVLIVLFAIFGNLIIPFGVDFQENIRKEIINSEEVTSYSPHKPNLKHIMGTNNWGYDQLSIITNGLRYTLIVAILGTSLRFIISLLFALPISTMHRKSKLVSLNSFPTFILAFFFLFRISLESSLPIGTLIFIQLFIIAILGIPSAVTSISEEAILIHKEGFIEAAYSCGASKPRIIFKHILPLLSEKLLIIFLNEMIKILNIVGQFGIFNIFIGGTSISYDPLMFFSASNELAGLIGQWRNNLYHNEWLLLSPLFTYLLLLFSFHFLLSSIEGYIRNKKNY